MNRSLLILLAIAVAGIAAAPVYKWVDEQGRVHFSDQPPENDSDTVELELLPPPSDAEVSAARARLERMYTELAAGREARAAEQERERLERELDEAERVQRLRRCQAARQNLHALEIQRPVYTIDEHGEYDFVEDDERSALIDAMRAEIQSNCD